MRRKRGPPTANQIRSNAERTFSHFSSENVLSRLGLSKPTYFYHYGITANGKAEFMGPESREEAERYAADLDEGEVFELDTRDLHRATQIMKAELIRRGEEHDKALQKVSHIRK